MKNHKVMEVAVWLGSRQTRLWCQTLHSNPGSTSYYMTLDKFLDLFDSSLENEDNNSI